MAQGLSNPLTATAQPMLVYDGACGFCSRAVQFILRHERRHDLLFVPRDSALGQELRRHFHLEAVESMLWVADGKRQWNRCRAACRPLSRRRLGVAGCARHAVPSPTAQLGISRDRAQSPPVVVGRGKLPGAYGGATRKIPGLMKAISGYSNIAMTEHPASHLDVGFSAPCSTAFRLISLSLITFSSRDQLLPSAVVN